MKLSKEVIEMKQTNAVAIKTHKVNGRDYDLVMYKDDVGFAFGYPEDWNLTYRVTQEKTIEELRDYTRVLAAMHTDLVADEVHAVHDFLRYLGGD